MVSAACSSVYIHAIQTLNHRIATTMRVWTGDERTAWLGLAWCVCRCWIRHCEGPQLPQGPDVYSQGPVWYSGCSQCLDYSALDYVLWWCVLRSVETPIAATFRSGCEKCIGPQNPQAWAGTMAFHFPSPLENAKIIITLYPNKLNKP